MEVPSVIFALAIRHLNSILYTGSSCRSSSIWQTVVSLSSSDFNSISDDIRPVSVRPSPILACFLSDLVCFSDSAAFSAKRKRCFSGKQEAALLQEGLYKNRTVQGRTTIYKFINGVNHVNELVLRQITTEMFYPSYVSTNPVHVIIKNQSPSRKRMHF